MRWRSSSYDDDDRQLDDVAVIDRESGSRAMVMETIFRYANNTNEDDDDDHRRIRVTLSLSFTEQRGEEDGPGGDDVIVVIPTNLIDLHVERRISRESTGGKAWTGQSCNSGGLDARSVADAIGRGIMYGDPFAAKGLNTKTRKDLVGRGGEDGDGGDVDDDPWTLSCPDDFVPEMTPSIVTLRLPQNLMIRYGTGISSTDDGGMRQNDAANTWSIEISHLDAIVGNDGGRESPRLRRRVVLRSFDVTSLRRMEGVALDRLGDICYWVEDKALNSCLRHR
jgi:hypothetical protein